jgi:hypothetical protein
LLARDWRQALGDTAGQLMTRASAARQKRFEPNALVRPASTSRCAEGRRMSHKGEAYVTEAQGPSA